MLTLYSKKLKVVVIKNNERRRLMKTILRLSFNWENRTFFDEYMTKETFFKDFEVQNTFYDGYIVVHENNIILGYAYDSIIVGINSMYIQEISGKSIKLGFMQDIALHKVPLEGKFKLDDESSVILKLIPMSYNDHLYNKIIERIQVRSEKLSEKEREILRLLIQ